jgi:hypothetical protein
MRIPLVVSLLLVLPPFAMPCHNAWLEMQRDPGFTFNSEVLNLTTHTYVLTSLVQKTHMTSLDTMIWARDSIIRMMQPRNTTLDDSLVLMRDLDEPTNLLVDPL